MNQGESEGLLKWELKSEKNHKPQDSKRAYSTFIRLVWNKAMEKSGLLKRTPHDMRHTYATLRLSKGDSLAEVSKEMGHGSPEITFRTYYT
ncbi:tyrosine-type recombinase/integrase [Thermodesulfobacteriota bacterium]